MQCNGITLQCNGITMQCVLIGKDWILLFTMFDKLVGGENVFKFKLFTMSDKFGGENVCLNYLQCLVKY